MPIDARSFPDPPGQCTVRVERDQDPLVVTTMPAREALLENLRPPGPLMPRQKSEGAGPIVFGKRRASPRQLTPDKRKGIVRHAETDIHQHASVVTTGCEIAASLRASVRHADVASF